MSTPDLPRVVVVAGNLARTRGGQERTLEETMAALRGAGVSATLLAAGVTQDSAHDALPWSGATRAGRMRRLLDAAAAAIATRHRGALIHAVVPVRGAHTYLPMGGLYPEAFARSLASRPPGFGRLAAALAARVNGLRRLLLTREAAMLRDPAGPVLIALSDYVAEQGRRHAALTDARIRIVRNGVDLALLAPGAGAPTRGDLGIAADAVVFLAAAYNARLKGIPQLVAAAARLDGAANVVVVIVGGAGPRRREGRCLHLGPVDALADLLPIADVVVHPTFYDPSSRVVLEGLAAAKPVITTRWNGAADDITGDGIVLDDPADVAALAAAMMAMVDPARRSAAAVVAGTKRAHVGFARHLGGLLSAFRDVAAARGLV